MDSYINDVTFWMYVCVFEEGDFEGVCVFEGSDVEGVCVFEGSDFHLPFMNGWGFFFFILGVQ